MRVSELYAPDGPFAGGSEVTIVGLGPSLKCYPPGFLDGKVCIFLNDAYSLVCHTGAPAIAFLNHDSFDRESPIPSWIEYRIRRGRFGHYPHKERDDNMTPWDSKEFYVFSYKSQKYDGRSLHDFKELWAEPDYYWSNPGGTVANFALQFAALAGFQRIYLAGCDCTDFDGRHYSSTLTQRDREDRLRARPGGLADRDYAPYREGLKILQREIWRKFQVPVMSLSPFMGIGEEVEQFRSWRQFR